MLPYIDSIFISSLLLAVLWSIVVIKTTYSFLIPRLIWGRVVKATWFSHTIYPTAMTVIILIWFRTNLAAVVIKANPWKLLITIFCCIRHSTGVFLLSKVFSKRMMRWMLCLIMIVKIIIWELTIRALHFISLRA